MSHERDRVAVRVAREILPHEGLVRNWLRRQWGHIDNARSYFFRTVQAVATDNLRRAKVESIRRVTEIECLNVIDEEPSAERMIEARGTRASHSLRKPQRSSRALVWSIAPARSC